ncbi:MAG: hypothetical protein GX771_00620 [Halomonadaceae bacterium]|nr:hypothetical protein [Halomonadaceae bacterium]
MQVPLNREAFARCENLSGEAYYILHHGLASYHELNTHLTLEDAITMIEFHQVSEHNRQLLDDLQKELSQVKGKR